MKHTSSAGKRISEKPVAGTDFTGVIETKRDERTFKTQVEHLAELSMVCRDAAALEYCRIQAGQQTAVQSPWPASTIDFFRKHARKFHE